MTANSPEPSRPSQNRQHGTQSVGAASATLSRNLVSPAAHQLAEVNEKDAKKGVKSRLRRALSFGSAAELRRASAENNMNNASAERARLRKERYQGERAAEQAAIAQKQEAAGIGAGIYSGQGGLASSSTDNLSISSTASSASIMIRKMGKGMKKSTRSLVGLFRPKSIIGAPVADAAAAPGASSAQVSMVTVEAERERVNVNVDPHDQPGGGTGYPKLERNSLDSTRVASSGFAQGRSKEEDDTANNVRSRKSIIGGELERAEVLAAVKKGILKRRSDGILNSWIEAYSIQELERALQTPLPSHDPPMRSRRISIFHPFLMLTTAHIQVPHPLPLRRVLQCSAIDAPTRSGLKARITSCLCLAWGLRYPRARRIRLRASQNTTSPLVLAFSSMTLGQVVNTIDVGKRPHAIA